MMKSVKLPLSLERMMVGKSREIVLGIETPDNDREIAIIIAIVIIIITIIIISIIVRRIPSKPTSIKYLPLTSIAQPMMPRLNHITIALSAILMIYPAIAPLHPVSHLPMLYHFKISAIFIFFMF